MFWANAGVAMPIGPPPMCSLPPEFHNSSMPPTPEPTDNCTPLETMRPPNYEKVCLGK